MLSLCLPRSNGLDVHQQLDQAIQDQRRLGRFWSPPAAAVAAHFIDLGQLSRVVGPLSIQWHQPRATPAPAVDWSTLSLELWHKVLEGLTVYDWKAFASVSRWSRCIFTHVSSPAATRGFVVYPYQEQMRIRCHQLTACLELVGGRHVREVERTWEAAVAAGAPADALRQLAAAAAQLIRRYQAVQASVSMVVWRTSYMPNLLVKLRAPQKCRFVEWLRTRQFRFNCRVPVADHVAVCAKLSRLNCRPGLGQSPRELLHAALSNPRITVTFVGNEQGMHVWRVAAPLPTEVSRPYVMDSFDALVADIEAAPVGPTHTYHRSVLPPTDAAFFRSPTIQTNLAAALKIIALGAVHCTKRFVSLTWPVADCRTFVLDVNIEGVFVARLLILTSESRQPQPCDHALDFYDDWRGFLAALADGTKRCVGYEPIQWEDTGGFVTNEKYPMAEQTLRKLVRWLGDCKSYPEFDAHLYYNPNAGFVDPETSSNWGIVTGPSYKTVRYWQLSMAFVADIPQGVGPLLSKADMLALLESLPPVLNHWLGPDEIRDWIECVTAFGPHPSSFVFT